MLLRLRSPRLLLAFLLCPVLAHAGMASFSLTEATGARLDVISFFLVVFALSALLLRWAWNVLAKDFSWLPRIGFKQALAMMFVSGLFLYVVLTMISGARELMTPGAWVKTGLTYDLAPPERDLPMWLESARRSALERLRDALWQYAQQHQGNLPAHRETGDIAADLWIGVHPQREPLGYLPGRHPMQGTRIIAFEPDAYGAKRFALQADGSVVKLSAADLAKRIVDEAKQEVGL